MKSILYLKIVLLFVFSISASIIYAQGSDENALKVFEINPNHPITTIPLDKIQTLDKACKEFAADSVIHNDWQKEQKCGYKGSEWSSGYQYHYNRCINSQVPQKEYEKRQREIANCICGPYASDAVQQNNENLSYSCGKKGLQWDSSPAHHFDWCARGGGNIIESHTWQSFSDAREKELIECKKLKRPTNLQPNGGVLNKGNISLTWQDPAASKPNSTKEFNVEVFIDGKKLGSYATTSNKHIINGSDLSYSANVSWKVRGKNATGHSLWAEAKFSIKKAPAPPPPSTGGINGTFFFDGSLGTQQFTITAYFKGQFISGSGTSGKKSFSVKKTKTMYPTKNATVSFSVPGLAKGKWRFSAWSNMTGAVGPCQAIVPGFVKLSVINGPSCN